MEQEDDRSVCGTRFAVEHMHPVSLNAMVGRQRNIRNVGHRFLLRSVSWLIKAEQSNLPAKNVKAHNGRRNKATAIKTHTSRFSLRLPSSFRLLHRVNPST